MVRAVGEAGRAAAEARMRERGVPEAAIRAFVHHYDQLARGETGELADRELEPVGELPALDELDVAVDRSVLDRTVVVKLNGGLGTSMGMTRAKSLIEARDGLSFLDIVARQVLALRAEHRVRLPLVLMHSFRTRADSLRALARYPGLAADVPLDFVQSQEPKLRAEDHAPVSWPADPALEWCPPGHGDLYTALLASGMLAALRERGYDYAFVSNVDNLGAVLEPRIVGWLAAERIPLLMECVRGSEADRKGGHIARRRTDGRLVVRETALVPAEDGDSFRDVRRWRFYSTNSLWIDLRALEQMLERAGGVLELPLIANRRPVDPADASTPEVIQLETAIGGALATVDGARALHVPRARFAPVKSTDDLLALRSDAFVLADGARVEPAGDRDGPPFVELDPRHYRLLPDFEARFPASVPSLVDAERLVVRGDVTFGDGVVVRGAVELDARDGARTIAPGTVLEG